MTDKEFLSFVRAHALEIEHHGPGSISPIVEDLRDALRARGLGPGCWCNLPEKLTGIQTAEWYAGQIVDISDSQGWFAMNTLLNCRDRFLGSGG
jgi:hypothetical protein